MNRLLPHRKGSIMLPNSISYLHQNYTNRPAFKSATIQKRENEGVKQPPQPATNTGEVQTSILYINDVHGKMTNMERLYGVSKQFDNNKVQNTDKLKLASGDIILGSNLLANTVASRFLDWSGFTANTLGNHEMDVLPSNLAEIIDNAKYKLMAINTTVDPKSPLYGKFTNSIIEEHSGNKYGIIGIAPSDAAERVSNGSEKDVIVDDYPTTEKKVQAEVNRLREQGINKIIILSHSGNENDKKLAQNTEGIDIILGAHSHNLIQGIKKGENLFYSKSGEPVVITQAGKDGENFGILNVTFDKNGVLTKVQNNVMRTRAYNRTQSSRDAVQSIIGKPEIIGKVVSSVPAPEDRLLSNNPDGNIIADAMRAELGTDIALLNAGNIRGHFDVGPVDSRLVSDITPFDDKMLICKLSEKDLVQAAKVGGASIHKGNHKPGFLLVSGLKYTLSSDGTLKSMSRIDKDGNEIHIDINNPDTEPKYTVAMDDFMATGGDGYLEGKNLDEMLIKKFDFDKNKLACDYIKKLPQPMTIKYDDRVTIDK